MLVRHHLEFSFIWHIINNCLNYTSIIWKVTFLLLVLWTGIDIIHTRVRKVFFGLQNPPKLGEKIRHT